jgi:hypothetical protein
MPSALFKLPVRNPESDWYTWDVVGEALRIPPPTNRVFSLEWLHDSLPVINDAFAPENWERTRELLAHVEEEKRRRFTEDRRVRSHVHA